MREDTREHKRLRETRVAGTRFTTPFGQLLLPRRPNGRLLIHFHGAAWVAEAGAHAWDRRAAVLGVQLGSGSARYATPLREPGRFQSLLAELERESGTRFPRVYLSGFSAGYGAVREILRDKSNWDRIRGVVLEDGIHSGYNESREPEPEPLGPFLDFAREAVRGRHRFLIVHSEVYPGTYGSTTECVSWLLSQLGLRRHPVLRWGPLGMQQLSEVHSGGFRVMGFAGNSAPDHVDHLHALSTWLKHLH